MCTPSPWKSLASSVGCGSASDVDLSASLASCITHIWTSWRLQTKQLDNPAFLEEIRWDDLSEEQRDKVIYHAGWTVKRVREDISRAGSGVNFEAAASVNDPSLVACSKADLLDLIGCLDRDVMQDNGTYLFTLAEPCYNFFLSLHSLVKSRMSEDAIREHKADVVIQAMNAMAVDRAFREVWDKMWSSLQRPVSTATTVLLQQICRWVVYVVKTHFCINFYDHSLFFMY